jgi:hypothetical protein
MNLSGLVEVLNPFSEFTFTDTPHAPDPDGGQFLGLGHAVYGLPRYLQQLSSLLESQQPCRLKIIFHRRYKPQCRCHDHFKRSRPFIGKSSRLRSGRGCTEVVDENQAIEARTIPAGTDRETDSTAPQGTIETKTSLGAAAIQRNNQRSELKGANYATDK